MNLVSAAGSANIVKIQTPGLPETASRSSIADRCESQPTVKQVTEEMGGAKRRAEAPPLSGRLLVWNFVGTNALYNHS
ncbi:MAG: hypothetical protein MUE44_24975 [Oscillatoriaceae cyanobacterium Prado104]|nr:hypothetical protein [Oscillatoriaceae cyanobacterium Prado104]